MNTDGKIKPIELSHHALNKPVNSSQCLQFHNQMSPKNVENDVETWGRKRRSCDY